MKSKKNRKLLNMAIAMAIAFGLWLYVVNVENPTGTASLRGVSVDLLGEETLAERDLMITETSDDTLDLKLAGRKKTLMKLDRDNVSLTADVSAIAQPGEYTIACKTVFPTYVNTDNVTVSRWDKLQLTVTVKERGTREVPVHGEFIGVEAANCLAGAVQTDPAVLTLEGPVEELERIDYALVQVNGSGVSDTIMETAPVVLMNTDGVPVESMENVTADTLEVKVTVPVRQVASVPLRVAFQEGGGAEEEDVTYEIKPAFITVVDEGADLPAAISLGQIDLGEVFEDSSYALPIHLPRGVTGWNVPAYATVILSFDRLESRQMATNNITFANVPQGYRPEPVSDQLYVWVRGTPEEVQELNEGSLAVEVDLTEASLGDELQRFPVKVTLTGEAGKNVGIVGEHYSMALRLTPAP